MVHMYRKAPGDAHFCSFNESAWRIFRAVAIAYGWSPKGTTPTVSTLENYYAGSDRHWAQRDDFPGDYEPEDVQYDKLVSAEDARNWAAALERAKAENFPLLDQIHESVVDRFIRFLRAGAFGFCWDD